MSLTWQDFKRDCEEIGLKPKVILESNRHGELVRDGGFSISEFCVICHYNDSEKHIHLWHGNIDPKYSAMLLDYHKSMKKEISFDLLKQDGYEIQWECLKKQADNQGEGGENGN